MPAIEKYRRKAEECIAQAEMIRDPQGRAAIAQAYFRLADWIGASPRTWQGPAGPVRLLFHDGQHITGPKPRIETAHRSTFSGTPIYVAIVDDDASMRKALARLLCAHGIDVRNYGAARDFLEALPSGIPDCLVADLNMPHMSGLELLRELLRLRAHIPTIVITGCDEKINRDQCRDLGATAYLVKPVEADALVAAISSAASPH